MAVECLQDGAQSATFFIKYDTNPVGLSRVNWLQLPPGKLRDTMTATYEAADGMSVLEVFLRAFAAAGGSVSASSGRTGIDEVVTFSFVWAVFPNDMGGVVLNVTGQPDDPIDGAAVRVSVSYSASE